MDMDRHQQSCSRGLNNKDCVYYHHFANVSNVTKPKNMALIHKNKYIFFVDMSQKVNDEFIREVLW